MLFKISILIFLSSLVSCDDQQESIELEQRQSRPEESNLNRPLDFGSLDNADINKDIERIEDQELYLKDQYGVAFDLDENEEVVIHLNTTYRLKKDRENNFLMTENFFNRRDFKHSDFVTLANKLIDYKLEIEHLLKEYSHEELKSKKALHYKKTFSVVKLFIDKVNLKIEEIRLDNRIQSVFESCVSYEQELFQKGIMFDQLEGKFDLIFELDSDITIEYLEEHIQEFIVKTEKHWRFLKIEYKEKLYEAKRRLKEIQNF